MCIRDSFTIEIRLRSGVDNQDIVDIAIAPIIVSDYSYPVDRSID